MENPIPCYMIFHRHWGGIWVQQVYGFSLHPPAPTYPRGEEVTRCQIFSKLGGATLTSLKEFVMQSRASKQVFEVLPDLGCNLGVPATEWLEAWASMFDSWRAWSTVAYVYSLSVGNFGKALDPYSHKKGWYKVSKNLWQLCLTGAILGGSLCIVSWWCSSLSLKTKQNL